MADTQTASITDQFYHVVNKGVDRRITFEDKKDLDRFIDTLDYYRFQNPPARFSFRKRPSAVNSNRADIPLVEIIAYCLMPDHFHLLLKQIKDGGISTFLSKATNSYTRYYNVRHMRKGPLFTGTFRAAPVQAEGQLALMSRYIHLNPLVDLVVKELKNFPFSSYFEYLGLKKGFCRTTDVLRHFSDLSAYERFVLDREDYQLSLPQIEGVIMEEVY